MAQGENAEKGGHPGKEFWSRRPYFGEGKIGKMLTHRKERRLAKQKLCPNCQQEREFGICYWCNLD